MQTNLRGRDFIGDLDFSKEEGKTLIERSTARGSRTSAGSTWPATAALTCAVCPPTITSR